MKRNALLVFIPLMIALMAACTTSTESGGTRYTFSWAYDIALEYLESNWEGWEEDLELSLYTCGYADSDCKLGRPLEDSRWSLMFRNTAGTCFFTTINPQGEVCNSGVQDWDVDIMPTVGFSNDKLAEMMTFCLNEDNWFWQNVEETPEEYAWIVYVSYIEYSMDTFRVDFYDIENEYVWGMIVIDTSGYGSYYDIIYSYHH